MAGLRKAVECNRHSAFALAGLVIVSVMVVLVIQRLPTELTVTKPAIATPSSTSQPSLFDTLLALHPTLPAAHEAVIDAFSRFKASLRPEPPPVPLASVLYMLVESTGEFVPVVRN